jgi:hypothetical protein
MAPDVVVSWQQHLRKGNVWKVSVELSMQDGQNKHTYYVDVYVTSPTQALAQYIVSTMYPDYEGIFVNDEPVRTTP